jgi:hypothetical protein
MFNCAATQASSRPLLYNCIMTLFNFVMSKKTKDWQNAPIPHVHCSSLRQVVFCYVIVNGLSDKWLTRSGVFCSQVIQNPKIWDPPNLAQILRFWVTWGVKMMSLCHGWGWQPPITAFHIHIRHIQSVRTHWYDVHWNTSVALHSYTHPLAQILGSCLWTAYQCAETLWKCTISMQKVVWVGCHPQPFCNDIILTPQLARTPISEPSWVGITA